MPTIDEIRVWLSGQEIEGLPALREREREPEAKHPPKAMKTPADMRNQGRYRLHRDDSGHVIDATLYFGKYNGFCLSKLSTNREGKDYLSWMLKQDFPGELVELITSMGWA